MLRFLINNIQKLSQYIVISIFEVIKDPYKKLIINQKFRLSSYRPWFIFFKEAIIFRFSKINELDKTPKKILIAGMPQSGSTAIFNLVTTILKLNNYKYLSFLHGHKTFRRTASLKFLKSLKTSKIILCKEHHFDKNLMKWADIIIIVKRDIRESVLSRRKRGKPLFSLGKRNLGLHQYDENTYEGFKEWCSYLVKDCFEKWGKVDVVFDHKNLLVDIDEIVKKLILILKQEDTKVDKVIKEFNNLDPSKDTDDFLSTSKITSKNNNYSKNFSLLSKKEQVFIEKNFIDFTNNT